MKLSWCSLLATSLGLAAAHGNHDDNGQHVPRMLGGKKLLSDMKLRRALSGQESFAARRPLVDPVYKQQRRSISSGELEERQTGGTDGQCGPGVGSCDSGYCCSPEGWCGKTTDYCESPDCQLNYGSGCDGNRKPAGADTSGIARPKLGSIPYGGAGIYDCVNAGDIAVTFDDGPYIYTSDLLDKLKSYGAKATFFITGNNLGKGMINDPATIYPAIIKRMHAEGHQIASHTWSHQNASQLTNTQFTNQMIWNEIALNSILGFFPTYMRPPYSICEKTCQNILSTLGYHVTYFDLDTAGYLNDDPTLIQNSKNIWDQAMATSTPSSDSFLQIEHDIHYQTVYNLTDYVLTSLFQHGYKSVTVGECLGDPQANWYRTGPAGSLGTTTTGTPTTPTTSTATRSTITNSRTTSQGTYPTGSVTVSKDGSCGNGVTCSGSRFGTCCSIYGFCGTGDDYCLPGNGCQIGYGYCGGSDTATTTSSAPSSSTPQPTSTSPVGTGGLIPSVAGQCGASVGQTCTGSSFGACCGPYGTCGSSTIGCLSILGCQKNYGYCV